MVTMQGPAYTSSVTITLPPAPSEPSRADYGKAVESLSNIIANHTDKVDPLSKKLFEWGTGVIDRALKNMSKSQNVIAAIAQERLDVLSKILVSPLDGSPLQDPRSERDWVWEARQHAECRWLFSSVSPFDNQPMSPEPPSHLFAKEMIDWLHEQITFRALILRPAASSDFQPIELAVLSNDPVSAMFRRVNYQVRAKLAQQKKVDEEIDKVKLWAEQGAIQLREENQQARQEALVQRPAQEAALQQLVDSIIGTCQRTVDAANAETAATKAFYEEAHAEEVRRNQENHAALQTLSERFDVMEQHHQSDRVEWVQQNVVINQRWAQTVSELEEHQRVTTQVHQEAVTTLEGTVTGLRTQLDEHVNQLHQTQVQLQQANAENVQNTQVIQNQRSIIAQMRQEIQGIRRADHSLCAIL